MKNTHPLDGKQYSSYSNAVRAIKNYEKKNNTETTCAINQLDAGCYEIIIFKSKTK